MQNAKQIMVLLAQEWDFMQSRLGTNLNVKLVMVRVVWRISSRDGEWASVRLIGLLHEFVADSDVLVMGRNVDLFVCVGISG